MKHILSSVCGLAAAMGLLSCTPTPKQTASYDIIPAPVDVELTETAKPFVLTPKTQVVYVGEDADMQRNAQFCADYLHLTTGQQEGKNCIILRLGLESTNPEAYKLDVNADNITIEGASAAGVFYGIQTLRKSVPAEWSDAVAVPAVEINDQPRFAYRGAHFDPCRHFFTVEETKQYIDMMALHNMNRLHWHLTEDQGWRIEIKKYPLLTEVGAKRPNTAIGHITKENSDTARYDGKPVDGFYTQEEAREIVKYAADRYITVIPEVDLPGHMIAALTAYPEYGCTGGPYEVWRYWGVSDDVLCVGKDETMQFLKDVISELCDIFPSEYFHIGGDESPKVRWETCPRCQARIKALGLKTDKNSTKEDKLQSWVTKEMEEFLASKGRKIIGWDEILEGGISPNATVMSWRGEQGGIEAARLQHDVIMTPNSYLYFDYYQALDRQYEPEAIGGYLPLQRVYSYEPMPASLTPEEQAHIIGVQGNLWTEYIPTFAQAQYMALPRWAALSEIQWSPASKKNWEDFFYRLPKLYQWYDAEGYNYAKHAYDVNTDITINADSTMDVKLYTVDNAPIRYTVDGSEPTAESTLYETPITVANGTELRAIVVRTDRESHPYQRTLDAKRVNDRPW